MQEFLEVESTLPKGGRRHWWDSVDLTDQQKQDTIAALASPDVSDRAVKVVLERWGVAVTMGQVKNLRLKLAGG